MNEINGIISRYLFSFEKNRDRVNQIKLKIIGNEDKRKDNFITVTLIEYFRNLILTNSKKKGGPIREIYFTSL